VYNKRKEILEESELGEEESNNQIIHHQLRILGIKSQLSQWKWPNLQISSMCKTKIYNMLG